MQEDKRDLILDTAKSEFQSKGLHGSGMNEIARKANVSKRTLYKHFNSKDELYKELINSLVDNVRAGLIYEFNESKSFVEMLDAHIRNNINYLKSEEVIEISRILVAEQIKGAELEAEFLKRFNVFRGHFLRWLEICVEKKLYKNDLPLSFVSDFFHRTITGMVFWPIIVGSKTEFSKAEIDNIVEIVIRGILSQRRH